MFSIFNEPGILIKTAIPFMAFFLLEGVQVQNPGGYNLSIGTTTTGSPGTPASVSNSGSSNAPVLNFTIPQGVAGASGTNGTSGVLFYLNGTAQTNVKCGYYTGTTSANGTATINTAALGISTVLGIPTVNASGTGPYTTNPTAYTATSTSILITGGATVSILGVNILSFAGVAVPYSVTVCGV